VTIPANASGTMGVSNWGWWGFDVSPQTYNVSFYVHAVEKTYTNTTLFTAGFRSNATGELLTSGNSEAIAIDTFRYSNVNFTINNNVTAPDGNNTFEITFDSAGLAGQTLYFSLLSVFPEAFKSECNTTGIGRSYADVFDEFADRENGLRRDLAEAFYAIKPKFMRFPGGNQLEGVSLETRWKWNETIGPLKNRKGRIGDWGYYNTDGLGLMEYLYWCEDMEMEPVLAVYAGYSLDGSSYPEEYMPEVLDDIMAELEFLMGNTST
jgi:alpha-N-arabinofuranosidase